MIQKEQFFLGLIAMLLIDHCTYSYQNCNNATETLDIVRPYLPANPVIFEAGAFDGKDSVLLINYWPGATIHACEPAPKLYEQLIKNTQAYGIKTYPFALGDYNGTAKFYISELTNNPGITSQSSSLLKPKEHTVHAPNIVFKQEITVPILTIDSWAEKHGVDHIDFMWIYLQGYELNALKASPKILATVKAVLTGVEFVEAYEHQYQFNDIKKWFEQQGFKMVALTTCHTWFGEALFVRIPDQENNRE